MNLMMISLGRTLILRKHEACACLRTPEYGGSRAAADEGSIGTARSKDHGHTMLAGRRLVSENRVSGARLVVDAVGTSITACSRLNGAHWGSMENVKAHSGFLGFELERAFFRIPGRKNNCQ